LSAREKVLLHTEPKENTVNRLVLLAVLAAAAVVAFSHAPRSAELVAPTSPVAPWFEAATTPPQLECRPTPTCPCDRYPNCQVIDPHVR
jgi:hypothetical protein